MGPYVDLTTLEEAEIIPGKHSDTRIKLALQRAAAARRALFRLPTGAVDELQNDELQTDLPAEVAGRSS